jgi:hypothetical protein
MPRTDTFGVTGACARVLTDREIMHMNRALHFGLLDSDRNVCWPWPMRLTQSAFRKAASPRFVEAVACHFKGMLDAADIAAGNSASVANDARIGAIFAYIRQAARNICYPCLLKGSNGIARSVDRLKIQ